MSSKQAGGPDGPETTGAAASGSRPEPEATRSGSGRRSSGGRSVGRWAAGLLLLAGTGALVAGSSLPGSPLEGERAADRTAEIPFAEVPAGPLTGVCPEPPRLLSGNVAGTDAEFSAESKSARSVVSAVVLAAAGSQLPAAGLATVSNAEPLATLSEGTSGDAPLAGTRTGAVVLDRQVSAAALLNAEPTGALQATAGAALTYTASDGDLRGLAAANCQSPANDLWLVGARTTVGATAVLQLTNPSQTSADVDLELFGSSGPVEGAGSRGIAVGPGETKSVVLAGLAANQESLAVRVRSSGGPVAAVIAQNVLRGLTPGGVELIQPTAAPAPGQVISGVRIPNPDATRKLAGKEGYGSVVPSLQVAAPGASDAVVNLRILGPDGEVPLEGGGSYNVAAGTVSRIPLDSLPEGTFTLDLSSDVAVTAAAVVSRGTEEGTDLAVAPAGERLGSEHLAVLPAGESRLSFTAPDGQAQVRLSAVNSDGVLLGEKTMDLAAGGTVSVAPADLGKAAAAVLVSTSGSAVYGAQTVTAADTGVSILTLPRGNTGGARVQVEIGY